MIDRLLAGQWSYAEFERVFAFYYYEHVPVDVMRSPAGSFVSDVVEKLEFTAENPTAEDRANDWIDHQGFIAWLRHEHQRTVSDIHD